jgi:VWFA-related protein
MAAVPKAVALAIVLCVLPAVAPARGQAPPLFRQRVDLVTVDVTVVDARGEPVVDLDAGDFEISVDGQPRRLVAFRRVLSGEGASESAGPPGAPDGTAVPSRVSPATAPAERLFVLVVDRAHIRPGQQRGFLQAAAAFVDTLATSDRVALWTVPPPAGALEPARDREALKQALREAFGTASLATSLFDISPEEAASIALLKDGFTLEEVVERECRRLPTQGTSCPMEIEAEALRLFREGEARSRSTLDALERLVGAIAGWDGPKHVVFITPGPLQTPDLAGAVLRVAQAASAARVRVHALQIAQPDEIIRSDRLEPAMPSTVDRGDASRAASPRRRPVATIALTLADETGGLASTDVSGAASFRRLARQLAGAYELAFEPDPGDRDGRPHRIAVRVAARDGLSVRARQQFALAPAPPPSLADLEPAPEPDQRATSPARTTALDDAIAPTIPALIGRLGAYVRRFEREFSSAVAEERYVQIVKRAPPSLLGEPELEWHDDPGEFGPSSRIFERRQLLSDVLLVQTAQGWVGYRDVAAVDGRRVRKRQERVTNLFLSTSAKRANQLRRVAEEGARYNLGTFHRTLNIPTLPLAFLHPRHHARYHFRYGGRDAIGGGAAEVLEFTEHRRPTLIGTTAGEDVPLTGRVWIDAGTGEVVQTEVRVRADDPGPYRMPGRERYATLVTRYRVEPPFGIRVPDYMWESYGGGVECLARYGGYRRFTVTTEERPR